MTDIVLILPDRDSADGLLARRDRTGAIETVRGPVDALSERLSGPYAIILPGQSIRAFLTDVPESLKSAERLNIARFAHEDQLASNPEGLHIVIGPTDPAATLMVEASLMEALLSQFDPVVVLPDFEVLSGLAGEDIALLDRVVTPGPQGYAVDRDWSDGGYVTLDDDSLTRAIFERLDRGALLNLRSGPYRRRTRLQAGPWGRVAAAVLICAALGLGLSFADARAKTAQAHALEDQARSLYTAMTGQAAPANLRAIARQAGTGSQNPESFLALSERLFLSLSSHPEIIVERLSFDASEDSLRLRLIYPGFEAASALEQTVRDAGASFTTGGVREQNGRFIGDAALQLGARP